MNQFPLLLAYRYLKGAHHKKSISTMVGISSISIFIGSFALMLVLAIMHGFEVATCERLQSIHSPLIIRAWGQPINLEMLAPVLQNEFPEIEAFSPGSLQQMIIQNPHTQDMSTVVGVKGLDPQSVIQVNKLQEKIAPVPGHEKLTEIIGNNNILMGQKLAESLDIDIGDTITVFYTPDEPHSKKITLAQHKAVVNGFFATGIEEFDTGLVFASLGFVEELFPDAGITHIYLKPRADVDECKLVDALRKRLAIEVYSWKDLYPALVSALKLEKYVMFIILALISLIASMNIISLIFMQINYKMSDIAILRTLGMSMGSIRLVFLAMGSLIALVSCTLGIACAVGCCLLLQAYPFISLPDAYFVTHLPVKLEVAHIILVFCCSILLSLIGILIPLRRMQEIDITDVLRYNV